MSMFVSALPDPPPPNAGVGRVVRVGLSQAFIDKRLQRGFTNDAYGDSFIQQDAPLAVFVKHILSGKANIPHAFEGNTRRNETFLFTELSAYDLELPHTRSISIAEVLLLPGARYIFLAHHTGSSGTVSEKNPHGYWRIRVYVRWSQRLEGVERVRILFEALARYLELPGVDKASFKPAQPYYGSTVRHEAPYINLNAEPVPVAEIAQELEPQSNGEMLAALAPPPVYTPLNEVEAEVKAYENYQRQLNALRLAAEGEKNETLTRIAFIVFGMAKGGQPGLTEDYVQDDLEKIARTWGGNVKKSLNTIKRARKKAPAMPLRGKLVQAHRPAPQVRIAKREPQTAAPLDAVQDVAPLTLRRVTRLMPICPEYVLIQQHVLELGIEKNFGVAEVAGSIGCSRDTAERYINRAMRFGLISWRSAELQTIKRDNSILCKNAERQIRGAAQARRYCLSPARAELEIARHLPDYVQELMEWGDPDVIRRSEAQQAGLDENPSTALENVSEAAARSDEADIVTADAERRAKRIADELTWLAETDETPFTPDMLAGSVTELRVQLIEAVIATRPDGNWRHAELMWVAGVKRGSVSKLIARSKKLQPANTPTFIDVPVQGKDLHRAVRVQCREKGGAPVAWLDAGGSVIASFSREIPAGAAGVKLNIGKKYLLRETVPTPDTNSPGAQAKQQPEAETSTLDPVEEAAMVAQREQNRARRALIPRLRGNVRARGWKFISGPFGGWERDGVTHPNTFEGMVAALLEDAAWAEEQRTKRLLEDPLVCVGIELGAEVYAL